MTRHILVKTTVEEGRQVSTEILGISTKHAELNSIMQREFDAMMDKHADYILDNDDTDASSFVIELDGGQLIVWNIAPYETF